MKVIVGLGNPGSEYTQTRHNIGFMLVDFMQEVLSQDDGYMVDPWQTRTDWSMDISVARRSGEEQILLVKPQTFMNNSGFAVYKVLQFYHDQLNLQTDFALVFDDLDLHVGAYKLDRLKYPKTHKGVMSVNQNLHQLDYYKVRLGIDARPADNRLDGEAYVLQKFSPEELTKLRQDVFIPVVKLLRTTLDL